MPRKSIIRYDDALPAFTRAVVNQLGEKSLDRDAFLRDAEGSLTFIVRTQVSATNRRRLEKSLISAAGAYCAPNPVATPEELLNPELVDPKNDQLELVRFDGRELFVRLIENRIVGQDWLRGIQPAIKAVPPIVVFASHKGGVGRSTALAIASADFARRGHSVLAIDLDLEAPGLGGMFLPEHELPEFGALDYFVENSRSKIDRAFLKELVAVSPLTHGRGRVMIVPAVGKRCREFPQNVIGKISRAYLEDVTLGKGDGRSASFLDQTRELIQQLCRGEDFDVIFLDARAGLNETTAATIQGLGADVLFFGVDMPQTWEGYRYLLAQLARFKPQTEEEEWRYRLKMVHAKASPDPKAWARFRDSAFELFAEHLYDRLTEDQHLDEAPFGFDLDDITAPHYAWPILSDPSYFEFDPFAKQQQLAEPIYARTFGPFLSGLSEHLGI